MKVSNLPFAKKAAAPIVAKKMKNKKKMPPMAYGKNQLPPQAFGKKSA